MSHENTTVALENRAPDGTLLRAVFLPGKGMTLLSYKKGEVEVIDQSTREEFETRNAGLGVLIGPHFYKRRPEVQPPLPDESLFPHIAAQRSHGDSFDPFSHGIGRYAPWTYEASENRITAILKGSDLWNGVPLKDLEGQNFTMRFEALLTPAALEITLSVVSDYDSIVGIHYYYHLPKGTGTVTSRVADSYIYQGKSHRIPAEWGFDHATHELRYVLDKDTDFTFHPFPNPLSADILLDTGDYKLRTTYYCDAQENSWQFYHPKGASFVCIEPTSAWDPRCVNLTVSSIKIGLEILK